MAAELMVLVPEMPGVSAETVSGLMAEQIVVERGCDAVAYKTLAGRFSGIGMIATANRLLDRARYYSEVLPCQP
jgi:hypothetical protein